MCLFYLILYDELEEVRERAATYKSFMHYSVLKPLVLGNHVRLKIPKGPLEKHSVNNWSEETYTVSAVIRPRKIYDTERYRITDMNGNELDRRYLRSDLLLIPD